MRRLPTWGWWSVLLFGGGVGDEAVFLAERGYDVTVADVDGLPYRLARHRLERRGVGAVFRTIELDRTQVAGSYDAIFCSALLGRVADPPATARALATSLRMGGILFADPDFAGPVGPAHPYLAPGTLGLAHVSLFEGFRCLRRLGSLASVLPRVAS